jgi:hypothetical protein
MGRKGVQLGQEIRVHIYRQGVVPTPRKGFNLPNTRCPWAPNTINSLTPIKCILKFNILDTNLVLTDHVFL